MKTTLLWYKKCVFYELSVRTYWDSNGDGLGDFPGLTSKLDYLQALGIDCLWLLPFYPSPLQDDGYDVSDYYSIHPELGTLDEFKTFLNAAHDSGIRVITDMVMNHVSSHHHWFQEARSNPKSKYHDYFVWTNDPSKYKDTRIIFNDIETSNWAYDQMAKKYYWHRFFSHQPDLNYDNPEVREEMKNIVRFWLDLGIDGFRCDAVTYLYEREGTSCESLPETHAYYRELRKMIDEEYTDKVLLAETNQKVEDMIPYFGTRDEFHMLFNFPLMPRMYLSIAQADKTGIEEIVQETNVIDEKCQWATFLRNHDELTLEMVTDAERALMWKEFAKHPKMKLNMGIRRRLAPLMDNDRLTIELINGLLFAIPGSPVIYYGDEIGMGDNIYLGDRNGVRTPMQWSNDMCAGFSHGDPQSLYLPLITAPEYHYEFINVRMQEKLRYSLLNWMRLLIGTYKNTPALHGHTIEFLNGTSKRTLVFLRENNGERLLCIFNLGRSPDFTQLDLSKFKDIKPIDVFSGAEFPQIGELPYMITLTGHRFLWLRL